MSFSRALRAAPGRLHFAAHSHHLWPDASYDGHLAYWTDAAALADRKWSKVFGEVLPEAGSHITHLLGLPDPGTIAFAPNTHDFIVRLFSCLPTDRPVRVLTTSGEFYSFERQLKRFEESGRVEATRIPVEPYATLPSRLEEAASNGGFDLLFFSQVLFMSGFALPNLHEIIAAVPDEETLIAVDGYHSFMAFPVDFGPSADRAFFMSAGYKYMMSGEGAGFMHCPPGYGARPRLTGWFAAFDVLEEGYGDATVPYSRGGGRFMGATFDAAGLYRFNAVQRWLASESITVETIHQHVLALQERFLDATRGRTDLLIHEDDRMIFAPELDRAHFLTYRTPKAGNIHAQLMAQDVITDYRNDRLRIGFGLYQTPDDVDALVNALTVS